ncbi:olfactory receptor 10AG1-like [Hyla sarda]|uniref:olfactory receptor 10AG1-like n=1 Tax=Hyla sarda TaxID=327740 RepID=UPI0024C40485|nr:olfactory receptor 10AG1-like [Hyla sarda]
MRRGNHTTVVEFILVGFSDVPELRYFLFSVFLCTFIVSLFAHMLLIVLYRFSTKLHTTMYFFLANFSFLEICYISTITLKMLVNLLSGDKSITFYGCALQMYFFLLLACTECYMLAAMAYDRYIAICHPLLYNITMSRDGCLTFIVASWTVGFMVAIIQTSLIFSLPFCGPNKINHFYCDIPPILALACTDTQFNEIITFIVVLCVVVGAFLLIMVSYTQIILTILKRHSSAGIKKAFSTCTSHLIVVTIYYGSGSAMYLRPTSSYGTDVDKFMSLMYTIVAPLLNPFIYSLRNNDVKCAIKKMICNLRIAQL